MRKIKFVNEYFYHIYNRGVEKRNIFCDKNDYFRFIHCLYEFNDNKPIKNFSRSLEEERTSIIKDSRQPIVDIICFCLMPNHFHLLVKQREDKGITNFMQKLGTGYTMYFNKRNERDGVLFQGTFKATVVERDEYLMHLSRYIHLNPVELIEPNWKEGEIKDLKETEEFLRGYRWSSYLDYIGEKNIPSVIGGKEFLQRCFKDSNDYQKFVTSWLIKDIKRDIENIKNLLIE
jgi:putative transposase